MGKQGELKGNDFNQFANEWNYICGHIKRRFSDLDKVPITCPAMQQVIDICGQRAANREIIGENSGWKMTFVEEWQKAMVKLKGIKGLDKIYITQAPLDKSSLKNEYKRKAVK